MERGVVVRALNNVSIIALVMALGACGKPDPEQVRKRNFLPPAGFKASAAQGKTLYANKCSSCHGVNGTGSGNGPPLVHKVYEPNHHGDLSFYRAASAGVKSHHWQFGDMAPVSGVSPEDVAHIIAYVRQEQRQAGIY